jgi:hypothetical protein
MNIFFFQRLLVFVVGFVIGFLTVLLYVYIGNIFESPRFYNDSLKSTWNIVKEWPQNAENYKLWRQNQNILISKVDLDTTIYNTESNKNKSMYILLN